TARRRQFIAEASIRRGYIPFLRELPSGKFISVADRIEKMPVGDRAAMLKIRFEYLNETIHVKLPRALRALKPACEDLAGELEALAKVTNYDEAYAARRALWRV